MKKWMYFAPLIFILGFAVIKLIVWKPFFDLVVIKDYKSIVKISLTVLLTNPYYLPSGETALKVIDGEKYIVDSNETKDSKESPESPESPDSISPKPTDPKPEAAE